jgi:hypothetical protein
MRDFPEDPYRSSWQKTESTLAPHSGALPEDTTPQRTAPGEENIVGDRQGGVVPTAIAFR